MLSLAEINTAWRPSVLQKPNSFFTSHIGHEAEEHFFWFGASTLLYFDTMEFDFQKFFLTHGSLARIAVGHASVRHEGCGESACLAPQIVGFGQESLQMGLQALEIFKEARRTNHQIYFWEDTNPAVCWIVSWYVLFFPAIFEDDTHTDIYIYIYYVCVYVYIYIYIYATPPPCTPVSLQMQWLDDCIETLKSKAAILK